MASIPRPALDDFGSDPAEFKHALAALPPDEFKDYLDGLPESALSALLRETAAFDVSLPLTPLEQAMELDSSFESRAHLAYLSDRIAVAVNDVRNGTSRQIAVAMPPRSGKSELVSKHLPVWLLRLMPSWKILLMSYSPTLVTQWSREVRRYIEQHGPRLGLEVASDAGAVGDWETTMKGEVHARSMGQGATGFGANVLLIDDPIKDYATAHNANARDALWDKWSSDIQSRREPPSLTIVVQCMTGDTPVLLPDGSERPLRDIRPGDRVATYEHGGLYTSIVQNHKSQGYDSVYRIIMSSGKTVRANARHPFLVVEDGVESWRRTDELEPGMLLRTAVSAESSARLTDAPALPSARASACLTTTRRVGLREFGHRLRKAALASRRSSNTGTGSRLTNTTLSSLVKEVSARSASGSPLLLDLRPTGAGFSASITTMTPGEFEAFSATTATSSSDAAGQLRLSSPLPPTFEITTDEIVSIEEAGTEEVFDLQVDGTENFIANGLVSHNTRWHEDDFTGRLLSKDYPGDPSSWEVISFPAFAEEHDILGREPGDPLLSPLLPEDREAAMAWWLNLKNSMSSYAWAALYQQRPAPASGAIFSTDWWRYWTRDPSKVTYDEMGQPDGHVILLTPDTLYGARHLDSWDLNFDDTINSDFVVGQRWATSGPKRFLLEQRRGRWNFPATLKEFEDWNSDGIVHEHLVEKKANGAALIASLAEKFSGIKPVSPTASKEVRARAVTAEVESGHVYLPHPSEYPWVTELQDELRDFPSGKHDDQVDALTQALNHLRGGGDIGGISNPHAMAAGRRGPGAPTTLTSARVSRGYSRR